MPPMNRSKIPGPAEASTSRPAARKNRPHARRNKSFGRAVRALLRADRTIRTRRNPADRRAAVSRDSIPSLPERLITHHEIERTANVGFERPARCNGVAARQCIEHFEVKVRPAPVSAVKALRRLAQIWPELKPQTFDDRQQNRGPRLAIDREVKGPVLFRTLFGEMLLICFALGDDEPLQRRQ